jgi:dienelactone hydrolase
VALVAPLLALPVGASGVGAATTSPNDAAGVVYPITSFLAWAQNPVNNVANTALGEYAFSQILDEAQTAVLTQFPQELDASALLGPEGPSDAAAFSEQMAAELVHLRPHLAGDDVTDVADPSFLPDFDHNGVFGDPGDYTTAIGQPSANGYFLYPCIADSGAVTYETTGGVCTPAGTAGDTYDEGLAQQETIVDSRGLTLAATLWLPAQALKPGCPASGDNAALCAPSQGLASRTSLGGGHGLPAVVISEGIASSQNCYYWLAMTLAKAGYIVLTYDPAGQAASEGSAADLFSPSMPSCEFGGACRDLEDVVRWLVGDPITPIVNLGTTTPLLAQAVSSQIAATSTPTNPDIHSPAYAPSGANVLDPARGLIDTAKLASVGHSMGALSTLNYLWYQGHGGTGADGKPLPPLATGIALSGAAPTSAVVPLQFQTSDYDGSPTLIGPAVGGIDLGEGGNGIGYADMKPLYDQLRTSGPGTSALSLVVLEGGVHTDFIDTPFITRTNWALAVSAHYATTWLGCFLSDNFYDCLSSVVAIPHLSSSFASEAAPPGGALPHASRCITVPTTASLNDSPANLIPALSGHPAYSCKPL